MTIHRRHFIQTTLGAAAAVSVASRVHAAEVADIRVAQIGFRGQGGGHINTLGKHIVALCDVDEKVLGRKAEELERKLGRKVATYTDYRKLLESKDFEAVSIATPNHTHALITIAAIQAGKDVYVEKPVSHNIWEGRQMVAAARKYGKIVQTGTQCRSSSSLRDAHAWLESGELGEVKYVVGTCYKRRGDIGKSDTPFEFPAHIARDLWIGPAADEKFYRPAKNSQGGENPHYDWHWDYNTGGGDLGNQGIHQMDLARWFLGEDALAPRTISIGGRLGYSDGGNTANTQVVYHAYEKAPLIFEVRGLEKTADVSGTRGYRGSEIGIVVQCEKGHILIPSYTDAIAFDAAGKKIKEWHGGGEHHGNWLAAIAARDPKLLNADIQEGHLSSALCHTGNVSYRLGKKTATDEIAEAVKDNELLADSFKRMCAHLKANDVDVDGEPTITMGEWLTIDPKSETFVGNEAASAMRSRKYRAPFVVPDIEAEGAVQTTAT